MARISTYPEDSTIHPNDHILGTNAGSAGGTHANETVVFPVSALTSHIRGGLSDYTQLSVVNSYEYRVASSEDGEIGRLVPAEDGVLWGQDITVNDDGSVNIPDDYFGSFDIDLMEELISPTYPVLDITHGFEESNPVVIVFRVLDGVTSVYTPDSIEIVSDTQIRIDLGAIDRYEGHIAIFT